MSKPRKSTPWGEPVCAACGGVLPHSCICDIRKASDEAGEKKNV